ncbi:hypothetical protein [Leptospira terpstrae]|nr:hypothetical protein [Leptospira terpstrae]
MKAILKENKMKEWIPIFLCTLIVSSITVNCDGKNKNTLEQKERITWLRKYLKESELLKDDSKNLTKTSAYFYQNKILNSVAEPEELYSKTNINTIIDFSKNANKRIKIRKLNEFLAIISTLGFDSAGELLKEDHLWLKQNEKWSLFELENENVQFPGQKVMFEEIKYKKGKFIILHGGCCDTESIAILEVLNNKSLELLFNNTLYGTSYKFLKKNGKLEIFERDIENNIINEISLESH